MDLFVLLTKGMWTSWFKKKKGMSFFSLFIVADDKIAYLSHLVII